MDGKARRLRRIGSIKEIGFRCRRNETILPCDLTLTGSEFQIKCSFLEHSQMDDS